MDIIQKIDLLKIKVKEYAMKSIHMEEITSLSRENFNHMVNIGVSLLMTKYKIGYSGGSFVQAFVNNDLRTVLATADLQNIKLLRFYQLLLDNCTVQEVD